MEDLLTAPAAAQANWLHRMREDGFAPAQNAAVDFPHSQFRHRLLSVLREPRFLAPHRTLVDKTLLSSG